MQLGKSTEALDQFNAVTDSSDDIALVGERPSHRHLFAFGFDGNATDGWEAESDSRSSRYPRRAAASGRYSTFFALPDSEDENPRAGSSSDELNEPLPVRRRLRQGLRSSTRASSSYEAYSPPARNLRTSGRNRKTARGSLRERQEDDFSEAESEGPRQQKYSGTREVFHETPHDDEFRQRHFGSCSTCNYYEDDTDGRGPLIFCQGCTSAYHQQCLGPRSSREHLVTKIGEDNFILQCRRCLGVAHTKHDLSPHLGHCAGCQEPGPMSQPLRNRLSSKEEQKLRVENGGTDPITHVDMTQVNKIDNVLFRCARCQRAYHAEHLPPVPDQDPSTDLFSYYSQHWQCKDCSEAPPELEELVTWRPFGNQTSGVQVAEIIPEINKEYLVKWKQKSYFRCTWMRGDWVWGVGTYATRRAFFNSPKARQPIFTAEEAIPEDNLRVDIVFDVVYSDDADSDYTNPETVKEAYFKYKGLNYEASVWESPPKPADTDRWNDFKIAFEDWLCRDQIKPPNRKTLQTNLNHARTLNFEQDLLLKVQPESITGGELMEYQLDGVNWLYYMFFKKQNAILADDMGLGKTIQVISLLAALIEKHQCWPFLVVAPNSTVTNWRREFKMWSPSIRVVTYFGSAFSRQMALDYEMFPNRDSSLRCHVVIASYESMVDAEAKRDLFKIRWGGLVVDEGQRLKNDKSQLYERLCQMKFDFKVLLTGTPLQNNIRELFNLVQFLDPAKSAEALEQEYGELTAEDIRALHEMIRPFFLRRTKAEVLPFLPPMVQIIVPVSMSIVQKKLYKSILGKNPQLIQAICKKQNGQLKKAERHNLNNILIQLRKCLCHPFIYNRNIEEQGHDPAVLFKHLVEASGKLQLLDLMLPKLRQRGHRVLIFSQFLENLDIVEDFLSGLGFQYCRLDGKLTARKKQHEIDAFNAPDSPFFAFLLSTRSGGVGINLASADTVIIMDPDFNPKQDMQALSRAHRIGQKNTVLVFHLTTRGSVEEKIMQKGKKKLALDHVLIERMEDDEEEDLESILRHGAQALFDGDDSADVHYDSESIEKLLDRSQIEKAEHVNQDTSSASTEQPRFSFARVWQNDRATLEEVAEAEETPVDANLWEKILRERERDATENDSRPSEGLGRGKRKRTTINYWSNEDNANDLDGTSSPVKPSSIKPQKRGEIDVEFRNDQAEEDSDSTQDAASDAMDIDMPAPVTNSKTRPFKRATVVDVPPAPMASMASMSECIACKQRHAIGYCPLKEAGVEHCGLCGLAHFGKHRACPHFHSKTQINRMLDALKLSTEPPELKAAAKKYLRGVLGSLGQQERRRAAKEAGLATGQTTGQATGQATGQPPSNIPNPNPTPHSNPTSQTPATQVSTTMPGPRPPGPVTIDLTESDSPMPTTQPNRPYPGPGYYPSSAELYSYR